MRYETINQACAMYHAKTDYDQYYNGYFTDKVQQKWDRQNTLDLSEVKRVIRFANQWGSKMQTKPEQLYAVLRECLLILTQLRHRTILNLDFHEEILIPVDDKQIPLRTDLLIGLIFDEIADCGPKFYSTGTSKILHTINPQLFVMWDRKIRAAYGDSLDVGHSRGSWLKGDAHMYARHFLPHMQSLAKEVVDQAKTEKNLTCVDAIESLGSPRHRSSIDSLPSSTQWVAKLLDEYNYARFTAGWLSQM